MKELMRGTSRSHHHAGPSSSTQQQQPLRRQLPKGQQTQEQKPSSCFLDDDYDETNRKKNKKKHRRFVTITTTISNHLFVVRNTAVRELRIRWRLLSCYSRAAILVLMIPLFTFHIIFGTIDLFFHSYGLPPLSYNSTARDGGRRNETLSSNFAVVINTYKRPDMLKAAVRHYADTCGRRSGVELVFVVWAELDVTPPDPTFFFSSSSRLGLQKPTTSRTTTPITAASSSSNQVSNKLMMMNNQAYVEIIQVPVDSLNSRFLPIANLSSSSAIFMVDDDVIVDCFSLHQGFLAWKSSSDSMVGYYPRLAAPSKTTTSRSTTTNNNKTDEHDSSSSSDDDSYVYHSWPMVYWRQEMNFVLTKAAFLHSRYLDLYSNDNVLKHQRKIKEYVDQHHNCEDVAIAMLIAHVTSMERQQHHQQQQEQDERSNKIKKMPAIPIYVQGHVTDHGLFHGISTGTGHFPQRSACLNDLTRIYRQHYGSWDSVAAADPLDYQVSLRQASWVHPAPGFWWQYRPSNIFEWFAIQNIFQ